MPTASVTRECWISTATELPNLDDGRFGEGWIHVGQIGADEDEFWKQIKNPTRRSVEFYISVFHEDLNELPQRFWLGVEWLTDRLYVATKPASPRALARRPPAPHPGLLRQPLRQLSARVAADQGQPLFERIR